MAKDPVLELAGKWFKKLNNPSSAVYQIAHARRLNSAPPFNPIEVVDHIRDTSDKRMHELAEAVDELKAPRGNTAK